MQGWQSTGGALEEFHYKLLKILQENPDLSQRALARKIGISLGKTNYCLRALIEKGWIKAASFRRSENKIAYTYLLTPRGVEEKIQATAYFLRRKVAEYEALEKEIEQLRDEVKSGRVENDAAAPP
jgi:EPS-associated MarR family transcriptional regulator